jgi:hypothetical protein
VIVILVRILRILLVLFLVRLALRLWLDWRRGRAKAPPAASGATARELVRDRVCNTFLPRERALVVRGAAGEEYFCSPACRDKARRTA